MNNNSIKNIDFMHIDVEGAEHRVIQGFGNIRPKLIWAETYLGKDYCGENAYDISELQNMFLKMGYVVVEKTTADTLYLYDENKDSFKLS